MQRLVGAFMWEIELEAAGTPAAPTEGAPIGIGASPGSIAGRRSTARPFACSGLDARPVEATRRASIREQIAADLDAVGRG